MNSPEGRMFRTSMEGDDSSNVWISGHRPCHCGKPGCAGMVRGVAITIDGHTVLASGPKIVAQIIKTLRKASEYAWGAICEHGVPEGDWCQNCNEAMKQARAENGDAI